MMALSGNRASVCQTSSSLPSPSARSRTSSTSPGGRASASRLRAWPTSPSRLAPAEKSAANSSTRRSSVEGATAPSPAAARTTARRSGGSKCLMIRAAGGLPIISKRAAAFSGPLRSRSPGITGSGMAVHVPSGRLFEACAGDDLEKRHAETLAYLVDHDDFAARHDSAVDDDVNWIADALVERDYGAARKLHETRDRQRRRAQNDLDSDRNGEDRAQVGRVR